MSYQTPKVAQDIRRLRADIEIAVRGFARFHKYDSGQVLREQMRKVQGLVLRAWKEKSPARQADWLDQLVHGVDQLRADMQAAQDVRAFNSLRQFQHIYRQVDEIGRQVGGWYRQKHPSAQSPQGPSAAAERGQILSTRAAPVGVNA